MASRASERVSASGARKAPQGDSEKTREPFFDPWLSCSSSLLEAAVEAALSDIEATEATRKRARSASAMADLSYMTDAIIANVAYRHLTHGPGCKIVFRLKVQKLDRYQRPRFRGLPDAIKTLHVAGWLELHVSSEHGVASTIEAGPMLAARLQGIELGFEDFKRVQGEETIILKRKWRGFKDVKQPDGEWKPVHGKRSERVEYTDTPTTRAIRRRLGALDAWLATADLKFTLPGHRVDTSQRLLRRHFILPPGADDAKGFKWNLNGRMEGGWWQSISGEDRRHIIIDGEQIADLDYSGMFMRLGCLDAGFEFPVGDDPYAIEGLPRDGIKRLMSAMLNFAKRPNSFPEGIEELFPPGMIFKHVLEAILNERHEFERVFWRGRGLNLMHTESELMMGICEELKRRGITGLQMYDGIMVAKSKAGEVAAIMADVSRRRLGVGLPVRRKPVLGVENC